MKSWQWPGMMALLLLASAASLPAQMIAGINNPVATDFGTYLPHSVTITPAAPAWTVAPDLSNVVNQADFSFNSKESGLLVNQGFFVTPHGAGSGYREIYDSYNEAREQNIPIFVTTDALLHTFHLVFDRMLMEIELDHFYGDLDRLLTGLLDITLHQQYPALSDDSTRAALMRTIDYLIVAKKLLEPNYDPGINGGRWLLELPLIAAHLQPENSPIFGYEEDYTQYIVRGHYTRSDSLRRYFQAMMWLGRMTFAADPRLAAAQNRSATLSALLLLQALDRLAITGEPAMAVWERIYSPTVFFVGKSDDTTPGTYNNLIGQAWGDKFAQMEINAIRLAPAFDQFMQAVMALPGPLIKYPGQPQGFRFMGQRFIPDSYMLDQLVYNNIPGRFMPKGLDVMAVLGSPRAYAHLQAMGEMANPDYQRRLDELHAEFAGLPEAAWAQNLYWNWLYTLMPLLFPKGAGYPPFMQNPAWEDKELFAALGSWAELRHDTILYAKQSGTERGLPEKNLLQRGYVEPNPHFYGRMASLAQFLMTGLENRGLLTAKYKLHLGDFTALCLQLKNISEKELLGESLSFTEYRTIVEFGLALEKLAEFSASGEVTGPTPMHDHNMPVIADVHSDFNSGNCLEEGVGYPFTLYVVCQIEGQLVITRGAGFSWYEFEHPMSDRLTDEAWREMLQKGSAPAPPGWSSSFVVTVPSVVDPQFYYLDKMGLEGLILETSRDTLLAGEEQSLFIASAGSALTAAPTLWLIDPTGNQQPVTGITPKGAGWGAQIPTAALPPGHYWLSAQGKIQDHLGNVTRLDGRTGFVVSGATGVDEQGEQSRPQTARLTANYPNPFNTSTLIRYTLAQAAAVRLTVCNHLGQELAVLVSGRQPAGEQAVRWDGRDAAGRPLASGLYFAVLEADGERLVRKMVMVE